MANEINVLGIGGVDYQLEDHRISSIVDAIYPVGSIYMSVNSANPGTLFGGTWQRIQDTFLLAAGQTYTAGDTGGEAEHTLIEEELPTISGSFKIRNIGDNWRQIYGTDGKFTTDATTDSGVKVASAGESGNLEQVSYTFGGNLAHNNMPPYLAVYMWQRTA